MSPLVPAFARIPVAPLALATAIVPWLVTAWLLSIVTAVPLVGFTEPEEEIVIASGAPAFTVEVRTGWVTAVEMVSAAAGAASAITAVRASRYRCMGPLTDRYVDLRDGGAGQEPWRGLKKIQNAASSPIRRVRGRSGVIWSRPMANGVPRAKRLPTSSVRLVR